MSINYRTHIILFILVLNVSGCLGFGTPDWKPGQYTLKEIMREREKGTYKETFSPLPYEEKINICVALFTQVRPPIFESVSIFEGADRETANRVRDEIIQNTQDGEDILVMVKTMIWEAIIENSPEEYREDSCKLLRALRQQKEGHWGESIRILTRYCPSCD